ncbi:cytochrome P450 [Calycina marina]|uniref:Cytochrome P450 n=1 Tax=Calycina marina TaxID=1763456 RepID=A0A9P7Z0U6_9HELO|nr:cytochrome P450 [Calycina marina]
MHEATAALTLCFVVGIVGYIFSTTPKIRRDGQPLRRPPNTLTIVGNGLIFLQNRHKLFSWFTKCEQQFGHETFEISVPSLPPGVVINDPKNLEYVFKYEGIFTKGDFFKTRSWDLFGDGIINADGELWKVQRKAGLHFLSAANMRVFTDTALPKYLETITDSLKTYSPGEVVDLDEVFHELTTQLMGRMAYDMDIHNSDPFSSAFGFASGKTGERFQNPLWQITEPVLGRSFRKAVKEVRAFGKKIVESAVAARRSNNQEQSGSKTSAAISGSLIASLLDSIDDHEVVAAAALNYLSAGRDTVAQGLTWTFYLMMRNPRVVTEIRKEIAAYPTTAHPSESVTFQISSMPYTTAVFYETLRLYPPVPFEIRQCEEATTLPDGTHLPKTAIVFWCIWAMDRSTLIWGSDAHEFNPERWLVDGHFVSKAAHEFPVFNGGSRTCLGKKMAEVAAVQIIATLLSSFDFEPIDGHERITKNSLTLPMEGGLPCKVWLRDQVSSE